MKWTNKRRAQLQIPASRLIEHCQATLEWTEFLWLNAFSSAQYYGGLFETKKKKNFDFFRYTLPFTRNTEEHAAPRSFKATLFF